MRGTPFQGYLPEDAGGIIPADAGNTLPKTGKQGDY